MGVENMDRPDETKYFMDIARQVAKRSTCLRHHVGAVLVKDKRILTTGYNGAPKGLYHCLDVGCLKMMESTDENVAGRMYEVCRAVHAEQNAIIHAAIHGVPIEGATLYCTHQPCIVCVKMLINAGVKRIVYDIDLKDDNHKRATKMIEQSGIIQEQYQA